MRVLLNPIHRTTGIKWVLVVHTIAMFSFVTINTGMGLNLSSTAYINHREFSGIAGGDTGPIGYKSFVSSNAIRIVPNTMFELNQWLADGLLVSYLLASSSAETSDA